MGVIYFVHNPGPDVVYIDYAATMRGVIRHYRRMRAANVDRIVLLCAITGTVPEARAMRSTFCALRVNGFWLNNDASIWKHIAGRPDLLEPKRALRRKRAAAKQERMAANAKKREARAKRIAAKREARAKLKTEAAMNELVELLQTLSQVAQD